MRLPNVSAKNELVQCPRWPSSLLHRHGTDFLYCLISRTRRRQTRERGQCTEAAPTLTLRLRSAFAACWWYTCIFATERLNGVRVRITGEASPPMVNALSSGRPTSEACAGAHPVQLPPPEEPLLIISNHKCNLDWAYVWSIAVRSLNPFSCLSPFFGRSYRSLASLLHLHRAHPKPSS